jgi:menaquinone-dependent protoporphyrinogen oxidase
VLRACDASDVSGYKAVLVGSAIRRGRWLPEAVGFLERQAGQLKGKTVSYFTACMAMAEDTPENRAKAEACSAAARAVCTPAAEAFFAGRMEYGRVSFAEQLLLRAMGVPEGDFRDWDGVRTWARLLPAP